MVKSKNIDTGVKIKAAGELKLNDSSESGIPCLFDDWE